MKNKIISIFVCMLLFATATTVAAMVNINESASFEPKILDILDDRQWVNLEIGTYVGKEPEITTLASDNYHTVLDVTVPGFWINKDNKFEKLEIPGQTTTMDVGNPAIPVIRTLVAIPDNAIVDVSYHVSDIVTLEGYTIYPFQEPTTDDHVVDTFVIDQNAYLSDKWYPGSVVQVNEPSKWRHLSVVTVEIAPISYKANERYLKITPHMVIELSYHYADSSDEGYAVNIVSPQFDRMYRQSVVNYELLGIESGYVDNPGPVYLIITHPNFVSAIQPLADWHNKEGMETEVLSLSTSSYTTVKNEIISRYNQGDLEYVLLVGDTNYMPVGYWSGYDSDYYYACITGSPDLYADIAVGRLSATSSSQVTNQVNKILSYEKNPPLDSWLKKIILVAHREDAPGKYVACKEDIRTSIIPQPPWTVDTAYGHQSTGTNAAVSAAINEGRNVVNYRGHGSDTSWASWDYNWNSYTTSNVNALSNGDRTPIVFNIACDNHNIRSSCLGETWLKKYPGGAVASLGATAPSYTDPNHGYDKELFRQFCQYGEYRIGWISNEAASYIVQHYPSYGKYNAKMYLWLGDPATEIWTDIPATLTVSHPTQISTGPTNVDVTVTQSGSPVSGATVCLYKDGEVYEVQTTPSNGIASFSITTYTSGTLYVTVTKHNYLPYEGTIDVSGGAVDPIPDIKINGEDNPADVPYGTTITVTVSLDPGSYAGVTHDWWIKGVKDYTTIWWWKYPGQWKKSSTPILAIQYKLIPINNYVIFSGVLSRGHYEFTFAVDAPDGIYQGT
ncbi:MAG: hypothetical protein DRP09_19250, partial [Candidatus Thorarchaeota archaeon]